MSISVAVESDDDNPVFEVKEMNCTNSLTEQRFPVMTSSSFTRLICVRVSCDGLDVALLWRLAIAHILELLSVCEPRCLRAVSVMMPV